LGHGLKILYPSSNRQLAEKMLQNGGIITEFLHDTPIDSHNFPKRNRIIAGMSDAIVVTEAHEKGGALITANIGFSYNRDVFTVPGKVGDKASEGCNNMIKNNIAALITSGEDVAKMMLWKDVPQKSKNRQMKLLLDLNPDEQLIIDSLEQKKELNIDELLITTELNTNALSTILLMLEFKGLITCLPGKRYILAL
jgi:DNA processing protein